MQVLLSELSAYRRRQRFKGRPQEAALNALLRSRTVFVHVPKCGGKSVITSLYGLGEHDWFGHPDIAYYEALLGPKRFAAFTKFAVLRDPVARCRSAFYFVRQGGFGLEPMKQHTDRFQKLEFNAFVQDGHLAEMRDTYLLFRPQYRFVCRADGSMPLDHLCHMDDMLQDLTRAVGHVLPVDRLQQVNASQYRRSEPVSPESQAEIERLYSRDFDLIQSDQTKTHVSA